MQGQLVLRFHSVVRYSHEWVKSPFIAEIERTKIVRKCYSDLMTWWVILGMVGHWLHYIIASTEPLSSQSLPATTKCHRGRFLRMTEGIRRT